MNGLMTGQNPLSGMSQEDILRLLAMIQMRQQQGMMQPPMMLAQNLVSPAKMKSQGVLDERGNYVDQPQGVQVQAGYSLGNATAEELALRERQRKAAAEKLKLNPNATEAQIRDAQMKLNSRR